MLAFNLAFFVVLLFSTTTTTTEQQYIATDRIFLNCGSSMNQYSSSDRRYWVGDHGSEYMPSNINTTSFSSTADYIKSSVPRIPYSTARISNTSFSYTFPVSHGPKFLRLHFFPTTYSGLNAEQSFLSVSSNGYSLLTNFSVFQDVSSFPTNNEVVKEFLVYVKDTKIIYVTFTPSRNSHAFINGIQIVSMPENLYYNYKGLKYVGMTNGPVIDEHTTLENMYRLNIGGRSISAYEDNGMYRSWEHDDIYRYGALLGVVLIPMTTYPIIYTLETPYYTAPEVVYQTQRSMGNTTGTCTYNLTWVLPVDSGFHYMLRLHFCNIIPQYTKKYDAVFRIFINNQIAEESADLFDWTQGSRYPVFRDYIVFVNDTDGHRSKQDLWLAIHPSNYSKKYSDAYLNGLEAFKLSTFKRIANPTRQATTLERHKKKTAYAVIIGGALVVMAIIVFIVVWKRMQVKRYGATICGSSDLCRRFSLTEVKMATDEFNHSFIIGEGGFGKVYKGCIDNATTIVAIKRLDSSSRQGFREFCTEIEMLSKLRHVQLVSLIGYCDDEGEMILVYDYMANGNLREHLYNTNKPCLSWKRRLDICIGVAKGLHYLHSGGKRAIIHGDVKSTNILLDENWVAKLSDFGLSKLGSEDESNTYVNTVVKGSLGYVDPEYCWTQQLTKKSDVYSFGVVLLEVLCARPVILAALRDEQVSLVEWGKTCYQKGTLLEIIDPQISGEITPGCLKKFGEITSKCLHEEGSERPAMEEVVWRLEFALQLQEDAEKMGCGNEPLDMMSQ